MKLKSKLLDILRDRLHKQPQQQSSQAAIPDDPQVTQAMADKIADDARKHRLAIEKSTEQEEGED
ncbi:hypothetical protein ACFL45_10565 [Candidatus Neomarinimicrobiota bacterium]